MRWEDLIRKDLGNILDVVQLSERFKTRRSQQNDCVLLLVVVLLLWSLETREKILNLRNFLLIPFWASLNLLGVPKEQHNNERQNTIVLLWSSRLESVWKLHNVAWNMPTARAICLNTFFSRFWPGSGLPNNPRWCRWWVIPSDQQQTFLAVQLGEITITAKRAKHRTSANSRASRIRAWIFIIFEWTVLLFLSCLSSTSHNPQLRVHSRGWPTGL